MITDSMGFFMASLSELGFLFVTLFLVALVDNMFECTPGLESLLAEHAGN